MGLTKDDAKIIVSTLFSALIGVTLGDALNCIGNGCWETDMRDITTAIASIIVFFIIYTIIVRHKGKRKS